MGWGLGDGTGTRIDTPNAAHDVKSKALHSSERPSEGEIPLHAALSIGETLAPFTWRFAAALMYFMVVFSIATVGYRAIEGRSWFDSFYMTLVTLTTVGSRDVAKNNAG